MAQRVAGWLSHCQRRAVILKKGSRQECPPVRTTLYRTCPGCFVAGSTRSVSAVDFWTAVSVERACACRPLNFAEFRIDSGWASLPSIRQVTEYLAFGWSKIRIRFKPECCVTVKKQVSSAFGRTVSAVRDLPSPSAPSDSHNLPSPSLSLNVVQQYKHEPPNREVSGSNPGPETPISRHAYRSFRCRWSFLYR